MHVCFRNMFHQLLLHLQRGIVGFRDKSQPVTHTKDVGIDSHRRLSEGNGEDHVCSLPPHSWQRQQLIHRRRNLAIVLLRQHTRHLYQMTCLCIGIAHARHIAEHLVGRCLRHGLCIGIVSEERGCNHIHTLVGALRT